MGFTRKIRAVLLGCAAVVLFANDGAWAQNTPVKFVLDWAFQGPQSIWPLAQERGCFAREGLDVTIDRGFGSGDSVAKVGSGAYDIGFADFNTVVQFDGKNPDNKVMGVFMVYDGSPTSVATLKSSGITKPQDLKGKQLADPVGDASRQLFPIFAKANGLDPASVTWLNTTPELRETMLVRHQADAIAGHMFTSLMSLRALGIKDEDLTFLLYPKWGVDLFGSALLTKAAWAEAHPKALTSFIRCTADGIKAAIADPKAAMAALKKRDALTDEAVETERLRLSVVVSILTDNVKKNGLNTVARERLERTVGQASEAFGTPTPKIDEIWSDKYLPAHEDLVIAQ